MQNVRSQENWEDWIIFILKGIEETATDTIQKVKAIKKLLEDIGILKCIKVGKDNLFINIGLMGLLKE
ncbi:MAG: hypothetical protein ACI4MA_10635 [Treponema sp.]